MSPFTTRSACAASLLPTRTTATSLPPDHERQRANDRDDDRDDDRAGAARALAITVVRAVGVISRGPMTMRALPAGPPLATPESQMIGPCHAELVLHLGGRDPYAVADEAAPLLTARRRGGTGLGEPDSSDRALAVQGAEVSALGRRPDGRLELRVVETSGLPTTLRVPGRRGELTDLAGRPLGVAFDGEMPLEPHRMATVALDAASPAPTTGRSPTSASKP